MKKRVAIATWVGNISLNYGSASQAIAMQQLIRQCGCVPVTINHYFVGAKTTYETCKHFLCIARKLGIGYICTWKKFQWFFKKNIKMSPLCKNDSDVIQYVNGRFNICLCGSDAIWLNKWIRPLFVWDYNEINYPVIAYAASISGGRLSENYD